MRQGNVFSGIGELEKEASPRKPSMPTFTSHGKDQIVFRTTVDERAFGLLLIGQGTIFLGIPLYELIQYGTRGNTLNCLIAGIFILIGITECSIGLAVTLKSEWLIINLNHGTYSGQRRLLLWGETLSGTLEDLDHIRLSVVHRGRRRRKRRLVVDWVWCKEKHRPFRISTWGRPESFCLAPLPSTNGHLDFFVSLRAVARDTGLPLVIPEQFLDSLGVADLELDSLDG
jgi:hypothetical protein